MGSPSPTPSIDLDTIDTSVQDISISESPISSNRNSRNFDETHFVSQPYPDLIPKHFDNIIGVRNGVKKEVIKNDSQKKTETMILLSILFVTIVSLYLFPPA